MELVEVNKYATLDVKESAADKDIEAQEPSNTTIDAVPEGRARLAAIMTASFAPLLVFFRLFI